MDGWMVWYGMVRYSISREFVLSKYASRKDMYVWRDETRRDDTGTILAPFPGTDTV